MNANVAEQLRRYARGEVTSRTVRDATGLNYAQVLDGLGELLREHLARNADDAAIAKPRPSGPSSSSDPVPPAPRGSRPC